MPGGLASAREEAADLRLVIHGPHVTLGRVLGTHASERHRKNQGHVRVHRMEGHFEDPGNHEGLVREGGKGVVHDAEANLPVREVHGEVSQADLEVDPRQVLRDPASLVRGDAEWRAARDGEEIRLNIHLARVAGRLALDVEQEDLVRLAERVSNAAGADPENVAKNESYRVGEAATGCLLWGAVVFPVPIAACNLGLP